MVAAEFVGFGSGQSVRTVILGSMSIAQIRESSIGVACLPVAMLIAANCATQRTGNFNDIRIAGIIGLLVTIAHAAPLW